MGLEKINKIQNGIERMKIDDIRIQLDNLQLPFLHVGSEHRPEVVHPLHQYLLVCHESVFADLHNDIMIHISKKLFYPLLDISF